MTTVELTDDQIVHLRTLLFEDLHEHAERLAGAAHAAHEGPKATSGEDAQGTWRCCGIRETAELLDLIGWSTREEAARLDEWRDRVRAEREGVTA